MSNHTCTFRDHLEQSTLMARALHNAGLRQNDVISVVSENRLEFTALVFGAFYLNAIVAPINTTYTERKFIQLGLEIECLVCRKTTLDEL